MNDALNAFLKKYGISPDDQMIIACSGGSDSMFLCDRMLDIFPAEHIVIAHFNHKLRAAESDADETFVREFARKNGCAFECGSADVKGFARERKKSVEESARILRYGFLD